MNQDKIYMFVAMGVFFLMIFLLSYMRELNAYTAFGVLLPAYFFGYFIGKQQKKS